jgi:hypothetical protein
MIFSAFLRYTKNKITCYDAIWTTLEQHNFLLQRLLTVYLSRVVKNCQGFAVLQGLFVGVAGALGIVL